MGATRKLDCGFVLLVSLGQVATRNTEVVMCDTAVDPETRLLRVVPCMSPRLGLAMLTQFLKTLPVSVVDEECSDYSELHTVVVTHHPDVIVLRVPLDGLLSFAQLLGLRQYQRDLAFVLLCADEADHSQIRALIGTRGVSLLTVAMEARFLTCVLRQVAAGYSVVAPDVAARLEHMSSSDVVGGSFGLTAREVIVLNGLAAGHTEARIAEELAASLRSVQHLVASARAKLGARDRSHAVALAVTAGIVPVPRTAAEARPDGNELGGVKGLSQN